MPPNFLQHHEPPIHIFGDKKYLDFQLCVSVDAKNQWMHIHKSWTGVETFLQTKMILILVTCLLFVGWFYIRTRKPKNFPPGPPRFPMVGSLPYMMGSGDAPSLLFGISDQVFILSPGQVIKLSPSPRLKKQKAKPKAINCF